MKYCYLQFVLCLCLGVTVFGQQRFLVSSCGDLEVIPPNRPASEMIATGVKKERRAADSVACNRHLQGGDYAPTPGTPFESGARIKIYFGHKDISAIWFEAPVHGIIESVFVSISSQAGDTTKPSPYAVLRVHRSNLRTGHAPGWTPYIAPPKVCWGYFSSSFDLDQGIAAFQEDASDSTWHSMYINNNDPALLPAHYGETVAESVRTFPPAGEEMWGTGGVDVPIAPNQVIGVAMNVLPPEPEVAEGEAFFISLTVPGATNASGHPADDGGNPPFTDPTAISMPAYLTTEPVTGEEFYSPEWRRESTNWKFYEHAGVCGPGWMARGGFYMRIWYTLRVLGDTPPVIQSVDNIGNTIQQTRTRTVTAEIEDCNLGDPSRAGVASATLHYTVNDDPTDYQVVMTNIGGASWSGGIPAYTCPNTIRYHVTATDVNGHSSTSGDLTYKTVCLRNQWFAADTAATRSFEGSIRVTGMRIDTNKFTSNTMFNVQNGGSITVNEDDGTAGPYELVNGFLFCGDTMHYAWIGVNGGIGLSKSVTDTVFLSSYGSYVEYDLPYLSQRPYPDATNGNGIPRNFIAPLWTNLVYGDSGRIYGNIYYKDSPGQFVVEWDSLALYVGSAVTSDGAVFRLVLNKADGTIEYQYDNLGSHGVDSLALVGLQSDSTNPQQSHGYFLLGWNGNPRETRPRDHWQVLLRPTVSLSVADGWNMISIPGISPDYRKGYLLPGTKVFEFGQTGYRLLEDSDTLRVGAGYWAKFTSAQIVPLALGYISSLDIPVSKIWNMIGSLSVPVTTSSIIATGTTVASQYFGYNGGYTPTSIIGPGKAYWVKVSPTAGSLHLGASSAAPKVQQLDNFSDANKITVSQGANRQDLYLAQAGQIKQLDFYELPPAGPEGSFDARFSSGRMVETYTGGAEQYVINLQSAKYPVTVSWQMKNAPEGKTFVMTDGGNGSEGGKVIGKVILQGQGSVRIENSAVKTLVLKAESGINMPTTFALSKNYPNPFNPVTRMQLDVPVAGQVSVAIYDVLGRKVATLVDGVTEAGYHTLEWNGTNGAGVQVPSGTYFVRVKAGEFNAVQKIMLMR